MHATDLDRMIRAFDDLQRSLRELQRAQNVVDVCKDKVDSAMCALRQIREHAGEAVSVTVLADRG